MAATISLRDSRRKSAKTYRDALDPAFRRDTLTSFLRLGRGSDEDIVAMVDARRDVEVELGATGNERSRDIAKLIVGRLQKPTLTFSEAYAIARVMACEKKTGGKSEEAQVPELDPTRLQQAIEKTLQEEYDTLIAVMAEDEKNPTIFTLTAAGDAAGLKDLLAQSRKPAKAGKGQSKPKRGFSMSNMFRRREPEPETEPELAEELEEDPVEDPLLAEDGEDKYNVLHLAACHSSIDCVRVILEDAVANAAPGVLNKLLTARTEMGVTALFCAIEPEGMECIKELYKAGADFSSSDIKAEYEWKSAMECLVSEAARYPKIFLPLLKEMLDMLKSDPKFDIDREYDGRRKSRRSSSREEEIGQDGEEAQGNEEGDNGQRAENEAHEDEEEDEDEDLDDFDEDMMDEMEEVRRIMHRRRMMDDDDYSRKRTLLDIAAKYGSIDCIKVLLAAGASPKASVLKRVIEHTPPSREDYSRYMRMAGLPEREGDGGSVGLDTARFMACIEALLEAGADVNEVEGREKETSLHVAARYGNLTVVKMLLDKKANVSLRNDDGHTPAEIATESEYTKIADLLKQQSRLRRLLSPPTSGRSFNKSSSSLGSGRNVDTSQDEMCVICYDNPRVVIIAPCGHKILCRRCARRILEGPEDQRKCPLDSEKIESFITRVYDN